MSIWQCAYTNVSETENGNLVTGWKPVCVSETAPKEALDEAVKYHGINSKITGSMVDEDGNVLNLYEINSSDNYVFVSKSIYGLRDHAGRANMFGHMFILPWDENTIMNPNAFIGISSNNFKASIEEADEIGCNLGNLDYDEEWTIPFAMRLLGIDKDKYVTLVRSVFAQYMDSRSAKPLYIKYDGNEEKLKAILYLVFVGLPYYFRKRIKVASDVGNGASQTNIIFCKNVNDKNWFLIPETGENNILNDRVISRIEKLGMVDYALANMDDLPAMDSYFKKLEERSVSFAGGEKPDLSTISMAHYSLISNDFSSMDDEELKDRIGEVLRLSSGDSEELDSFLSKHVNEAYRRDIALFPKTEERLHEKFQNKSSEELKDTIKRYFIQRITALDIKDASDKLLTLSNDEFAEYKQILINSEKGNEILDNYYSQKVLSSEGVTWKDIADIEHETRNLLTRNRVLEALNDKAHKLYTGSLKKKEDEYENFLSYKEYLTEMYGEEGASSLISDAKEEYWDNKSIKDYSHDDSDIYVEMESKNHTCLAYSWLRLLLSSLESQGVEVMLRQEVKTASKLSNHLEADKLEQVYSILESNAKRIISNLKNISPSDAFISNQIKIASHDLSAEQIMSLQALRDAYDNKSVEGITDNYGEFMDACANKDRTITNEMSDMVLSMFNRLERREGVVVPVDEWLRVGETMCRNPFRIFDEVSPYAFRDDKKELKSDLMQDDYFKEKAKEYIKSKGEASKEVKLLLKTAKKKEKKYIDIEDFDDLEETKPDVKSIFGNIFRKRNDD